MHLHRQYSWRRNQLGTIDPIIRCIYARISRVSTQVELRLYTLNRGSCIGTHTHTHTFNPPWYPQFHTPNSLSIQHNFDQFVDPQPEESMHKNTHIIKIITRNSQIQCKTHEKLILRPKGSTSLTSTQQIQRNKLRSQGIFTSMIHLI